MDVKIPIYKHPVKKWLLLGYGLPALVFTIGAVMQYSMNHEEALARAGSVIVLIAALLASKDVKGRYVELEEEYKDMAEKSGMQYFKEPGIKTQKDLKQMEALLAAFGTLTWGFGDLSFCSYVAISSVVFIALFLVDHFIDQNR